MTTHHTPDELRVRLRMTAGRCEIETAETDRTQVDVEPLDDSPASRAAAEELVESLRDRRGGKELVIEIPSSKLLRPFRGDAAMLVRIRAPHGMHLDARTVSAGIAAAGRLGDVDVHTVSGGREADAVDGRATLKTTSGGMRIGTLTGPGTVNTVSGDIRIDAPEGESLTVRTVSGAVRVARAQRGRLDVRNVSGAIEVAVAPGATLWVDASSASGEVVSDLPVTDTAPAGGADLELRAASASGRITLTRAESETRAAV